MRVVCAQPRDALVVTAYFGEALDVIKKGGSSTRKTKYLIQFPAAFRSGLHLRRSGPALLPAGNYAGPRATGFLWRQRLALHIQRQYSACSVAASNARRHTADRRCQEGRLASLKACRLSTRCFA